MKTRDIGIKRTAVEFIAIEQEAIDNSVAAHGDLAPLFLACAHHEKLSSLAEALQVIEGIRRCITYSSNGIVAELKPESST